MIYQCESCGKEEVLLANLNNTRWLCNDCLVPITIIGMGASPPPRNNT